MCTVTYYRNKNKIILTSSRDEQPSRSTMPPVVEKINNQSVCFPKDSVAGGSWIAVSEKQTWACLLNGAETHGLITQSYPDSRGHIVLNYFRHTDRESFTKSIQHLSVAPYTLLLYDKSQKNPLIQMQWNGANLLEEVIDFSKPFIRSSSTLYNAVQKQKRLSWFHEWLDEHDHHEEESLSRFHLFNHSEDASENILMKRNGVQTVSISQIVLDDNMISFTYRDVLKNKVYAEKFNIE